MNQLPSHKAGLFLQHNEHKGYYETAEEWIGQRQHPSPAWKSPESCKIAIETDSVWTLQWYPDTPVGFNYIAAPTLEELLEFAKEIEGRGP